MDDMNIARCFRWVDARGDNFRSVVFGCISEEEAGIRDVKKKLRRVED
jgi:hypothetical protein